MIEKNSKYEIEKNSLEKKKIKLLCFVESYCLKSLRACVLGLLTVFHYIDILLNYYPLLNIQRIEPPVRTPILLREQSLLTVINIIELTKSPHPKMIL